MSFSSPSPRPTKNRHPVTGLATSADIEAGGDNAARLRVLPLAWCALAAPPRRVL